MPRSLKSSQKSRHDPLHRDIAADDLYAKYGTVSKPGKRTKARRATEHDEDGSGEVTLSRLVNVPSPVGLTRTPFLRPY
jgi:essential nuclear protein 1